MRKNLISKLLGGIFISTTLLTSTSAFAADSLNSSKITLTAEPDSENNRINLKWNKPDSSNPYTYQIYSKEKGEEATRYQSIPLKNKIKVLNIYPGANLEKASKYKYAGRYLKKWMNEPALQPAPTDTDYDVEYTNPSSKKTQRYVYIKNEDGNFITNGRNLVEPDPNNLNKPHKNPNYNNDPNNDEYILATKSSLNMDIEEISIDEFDNYTTEGKNYLLDSKGNYKYDVIFLGSCDSNNYKYPSKNSFKYITDFIESGRGYLGGHDTACSYTKNYMNLDGAAQKIWYGAPSVRINHKGLLTNYPWNIGEKGTTLDVPMSHSGQFVYGDVWLEYTENTWPSNSGVVTSQKDKKGTNNFYLTTWQNTAMIQTGHSSGQATPDEEKILANTLFYLPQLTTNTSWSDHKGQDLAAPDKPNITGVNKTNKTISIDQAKDNGSTYNYYITAKNENTNEVITTKDNPIEATITTGTDKYLFTVDENKNTDIATKAEENLKNKKDIFAGIQTSTETKFNYDGTFNDDFYVHVAAVDKAGNISKTSTYTNTKPTLELNVSPEEDTNSKVTIKATASTTSTNNTNAYDPKLTISKISCEGEDLTLTKIDDRTFSANYEASSNKKYTFVATDSYGNTTTQSIEINNIHPIILDVNPKLTDAGLAVNDKFEVNLSLKNTKDIIKDIDRQEITINYDKEKLHYLGCDDICNCFIMESHHNTETGQITFSLKSNDINLELLTNKLLTLHFTTISSGKAYVNVDSNSKLYDSEEKVKDLRPIECGSTEISITL